MSRLMSLIFAACLLAIGTSSGVLAAESEHGTKAEAVAMVKRVQDMFKKEEADATFKAVSDPSKRVP